MGERKNNKGIKTYSDLNIMKTTYQNMWGAAKVVLRTNFIAVNAYIGKK